MSYPVPSIDPSEKKYPADDYNPVRKSYKKTKMAKKMSKIDKLKELIKESENMRKKPFNFFKGGQGGGGLPPGRRDRDND